MYPMVLSLRAFLFEILERGWNGNKKYRCVGAFTKKKICAGGGGSVRTDGQSVIQVVSIRIRTKNVGREHPKMFPFHPSLGISNGIALTVTDIFLFSVAK